ERRLMYVALTRATDYLMLSRAESRMLYGRLENNMMSRFLSEIPEELLEKPVNQSIFSNNNSSPSFKTGPKKKARIIQNNNEIDFSIGEKVSNKVFGDGIVSTIKCEADNTELDIVFKTAGPKRLLANYAPLEKKD